MFVVCRGRSQEKGQGHATGPDDGRHGGRRRHGPDGVETYRPDGWQGAVTEQNRAAPVRYDDAQKSVPAAANERTQYRVAVFRPPLWPQHRRPPHGVFGPNLIARYHSNINIMLKKYINNIPHL